MAMATANKYSNGRKTTIWVRDVQYHQTKNGIRNLEQRINERAIVMAACSTYDDDLQERLLERLYRYLPILEQDRMPWYVFELFVVSSLPWRQNGVVPLRMLRKRPW
jgi:hypothetical protein